MNFLISVSDVEDDVKFYFYVVLFYERYHVFLYQVKAQALSAPVSFHPLNSPARKKNLNWREVHRLLSSMTASDTVRV